jgi:hypothetical protein
VYTSPPVDRVWKEEEIVFSVASTQCGSFCDKTVGRKMGRKSNDSSTKKEQIEKRIV